MAARGSNPDHHFALALLALNMPRTQIEPHKTDKRYVRRKGGKFTESQDDSHFNIGGDPMRKVIIGSLLATTMLMPAFGAEMWRSSKLIGLNVYNDQNEKLGDISEILMDKSGKVEGVVIGVGGFLGLGQHDIKVEMSKLKFVDEPVRTASSPTTGSATTPSANRPATTTPATTTTANKWYPDHAVLSGATKDSLKNMAEFKYD